MNRKQFIFILLALAIVGGAGLVLLNRNQHTWTVDEAKVGDKALPNFPINSVASIHVKGAHDFTVARTNDIWRVLERDDYPANFAMVSDFLMKIHDLKVVQSDVIGPSQFPRLNLNAPGSQTNGATLFEFKDEHGAVLTSFLSGKKHDKPQDPNEPLGMHGFFDGRYILLPSDLNNVLLVSDELSAAEPTPAAWLAHDFFKVENIKLISLLSPNPLDSWEMSRENSSSPWVLANATPNEILDTNVCYDPGEILAFPTFEDVLPKTPENLAHEGLDKPVTVTVLTDDLAYTLKVGPKHPNGLYPMTVAIAGNIPPQRVGSPDESPEDRTRLDAEYQARAKDVQAKLAKGQVLSPWIFEVDHWIEMVIHTRSDLIGKKTIGGEQAAAQ